MAGARSMLQRLYCRIQPESWLDLEKGAEDTMGRSLCRTLGPRDFIGGDESLPLPASRPGASGVNGLLEGRSDRLTFVYLYHYT